MGMGGMGTQKAKLKRVGVHAASSVRRARHPRRSRHVPPSTRPCPPVSSPPLSSPEPARRRPIYAPAPLPILSFCPPNHRDESNNSSSNGGRGHGRLSRAPRPAGAIDESSCSTLHGRTRCPLWLRRPPWGPRRWLLPRRRRTGCAAVPAVAGRGRGRTSCTTRRRRRKRRRRRRCSRGGGLAVRATGCSCWRRWRKRRKGRPRPRTSGPPLAPSPRGTRRKGRRWRAPGRRRGRGGRRRAPARSPASTPSTTPSPSSGGCRASSPASRGRSRTCRTWRSPAPPLHQQQGRAGQAGEPLQQAAPDPAVLLHPAGLLHLAHRAAALPAARAVLQHRQRRRHQRRRRRWLIINRSRDAYGVRAPIRSIQKRKDMHIHACKFARELATETTTLLGRRETRWMDVRMDPAL